MTLDAKPKVEAYVGRAVEEAWGGRDQLGTFFVVKLLSESGEGVAGPAAVLTLLEAVGH